MNFVSFSHLATNQRALKIFTSRLISITQFTGDSRSNIKCPFHDDSTASAKVHHDGDGVDRLFCFSCGRQYTSSDYIQKFISNSLPDYLKSRFSESLLDSYVVSMGDIEVKQVKEIDVKPVFDRCLKGSGSFVEGLSSYLKKVYLKDVTF